MGEITAGRSRPMACQMYYYSLLLSVTVLASPLAVSGFFGGDDPTITCTLEFFVNPDASKFALSGVSTSPVVSNLLAVPRQTVGAIGTFQMTYSLKSAFCPENATESYARMIEADAWEISTMRGIDIYPSVIAANFGKETLRVSGVAFGLIPGPVRAFSNFSENVVDIKAGLELGAEADGAWVGDDSMPAEPNLAEFGQLAEVNSHNVSGTMTIKGSEIEATFNGVSIVLQINATNGNETVVATVNLTGEIVATATVGCSPPCSSTGKCAQQSNGRFECLCECGWSGDACDIPKGFCPRYADMLIDSQGVCSGRKRFDPGTRECSRCIDGWMGNNCSVCETNDACNAFFDDKNRECRTNPQYYNQTELKVYSCDLKGTPFESFVGRIIEFTCNTTGGSNPGQSSGESEGNQQLSISEPFCELSLKWKAKKPVKCFTSPCTFSPGSTYVECEKGVCECEGGCTGGASVFANGAEKISMDCDKDSNCDVTLDSFGGVTIKAACSIAECFDPDGDAILGEGNARKMGGEEAPVDALILIMPFAIVFTIAFILFLPTIVFQKKINGPPSGLKYGASSRKMPTKSPITEVRFINVFCSVPFIHKRAVKDSSKPGKVSRKASCASSVDGEFGSDSTHGKLKGINAPVATMLETRKGFKSVLQNISCVFKSGEVVGIMGPSGSGKSTLLGVLSGMSVFDGTRKLVRGSVRVNGKKRGPWIKRWVSFVPQDDHLMAMLTVRECLSYSAVLRLPVEKKMDKIHKQVYTCLTELGLEQVADSRVGGVRGVRGISGGERRRVTIGMELVTQPSILLMDEPMSGLDSFTATSLLTSLGDISSHGRLVVLSVHQPSPVMFHMFDKILLLAHGFQVYTGPPVGVESFFDSHQFPLRSPLSIAEHMIEIVSHTDTLVPLINRIFTPNTNPNPNPEDQQNNNGNNNIGNNGNNGNSIVPLLNADAMLDTHTTIATPGMGGELEVDKENGVRLKIRVLKFLRGLQVCFWRGLMDIVRNKALLISHWLMAIFMGVALGAIFFQQQKNTSGAQNRFGGAFFVLAFLAFTASTTVDFLHAESTVVMREVKAGYYNSFVYVLSKIILDSLLLRAIPGLLLCIPFYFMMGLKGDVESIMIFMGTATTFNMLVGTIAMCFTILIPNAGAATLVINIFFLISLLFGNFLVNVKTIPHFLGWIHHSSIIGYAVRIMTINELDGGRYELSVSGELSGSIKVNGLTMLETLGIDPSSFHWDVILLVAIYGSSVIFALFIVWLRAQIDKSSTMFQYIQIKRERWVHTRKLQANMKSIKRWESVEMV